MFDLAKCPAHGRARSNVLRIRWKENVVKYGGKNPNLLIIGRMCYKKVALNSCPETK